MKTIKDNNSMKRQGSALILVIVVSVLLAVIGMMFVMVSRLEGVLSASVIQDRELDEAVNMTTARIEQILMKDLFGGTMQGDLVDDSGAFFARNEPYDCYGRDDGWLAPLEPVRLDDNGTPGDSSDDLFQWTSVTNLQNNMPHFVFDSEVDNVWDRVLRDTVDPSDPLQRIGIVPEYQDAQSVDEYHPADADGDGVADSVWIRMDGSTCRGRDVYAAVRIIDNCAMLNLNTAFPFFLNTSSDTTLPLIHRPWYLNYRDAGVAVPYIFEGRYLSEVNYVSFLRGMDRDSTPDSTEEIGWSNWYNLLLSKVSRGEVYINDQSNLAIQLPSMTQPELFTPEMYHEHVMEKLGKPDSDLFQFFGIQDELEIRNRFLLTSLAHAAFESEKAGHHTFDFGQGQFGGSGYAHIRSRRIPYSDSEFGTWKERMDSMNFDPNPPINQYDRRHICTFYSYDRNLRPSWQLPPLNSFDPEDYRDIFMPEQSRPVNLRENWTGNTMFWEKLAIRRKLVQLLYVLRDYYYHHVDQSMPDAARFSAQVVANLIDYLDDDTDALTGPLGNVPYDPVNGNGQSNEQVTYINRDIIRQLVLEVTTGLDSGQVDIDALDDPNDGANFHLNSTEVVYGIEQQPFISEVVSFRDSAQGNNLVFFAVELVNPYDSDIVLNGWKVSGAGLDYTITPADNVVVPARDGTALGRLVLWTNGPGYLTNFVNDSATNVQAFQIPQASVALENELLRLQRPIHEGTDFLTVDVITQSQLHSLFENTGIYSLRRDDQSWSFTCNDADNSATLLANDLAGLGGAVLGVPNTGSSTASIAIPIANDNSTIYTTGDFQKLLWIGNTEHDPNCLTSLIGMADDENELRYDPNTASELMDHLCTLARPEGSLPGRININTAPQHVIAAAIPRSLAGFSSTPLQLAEAIIQNRPYRSISDLLQVTSGLQALGADAFTGELERRDWVFNRLSNIFTVRSDVFTAYILVRVGRDGPQRRMLAIFDRSGVWSPEDRPRLVALHPVSGPR